MTRQVHPGPLSNLRVVDVSASLAGAYCARLLADLGAEVLRVERPGTALEEGDLATALNTGKGTVDLDVASETGRTSLQGLLHAADLLVEDGRLLREVLPWEAVQGLSPALTVISVSPFGSSGPYADYAASDLTLWAWSGLAWASPGVPDTSRDLEAESPLAPAGVSVAGLIAGAVAAAAALAALAHEDGRGRRVEVSEHEALVALNYNPIAQYEYLRSLWPRGPNIIARQPNCYIPCKDGWLVLVAMSPQHWGALVEEMGRPEWADSPAFADASTRAANWDALEPLLTEWTVARTGREITEALQARGLPVYWAATLREAVTSPQVVARRFLRQATAPDGRPISFPGLPFVLSDFPRPAGGRERTSEGLTPRPLAKGVPRGRAPLGVSSLPLAGVRVLDFGQYIAVPFAAQWLGALGADVIQVESRQNPFDSRQVPPFADGVPGLNRAGSYNALNAGKRSVSLNLRTPQGREVARRLAAVSDLVMENYSTGTMERWGLGYADLSALNPRLVFVSVAAFGRTGPLKDYGGLHSIVNAFSGLADVTGYPGGHPRILGSYFPDVVSGTYAVLATLAALRHRERTDRGQFVDLAMVECLMTLVLEPMLEMARTGREPERTGNRHPRHAPHGVYRCAGEDQWAALAVRTDAEWQGLCRALGRPDWAGDSRYAGAAGRKEDEDDLDRTITAWTRQRTKEEATRTLLQEGVPAAPCLDQRGVVEDPHLRARGFLALQDHPEVGPRRGGSLPWRVDDTVPGLRRPAPLVGQYTASILHDLLGMTEGEIAELERAGALD